MIPYDDLVAALQAWRARKGLPVAASHTGSAPVPVSGATPGSGPRTGPPAPPRTNPPAPPRSPMPLAAPEDSLEVDDAAMIDESAYENEGDDFAMAFGKNGGQEHESTEIGGAPARPSEPTDPARTRGNNRDDW